MNKEKISILGTGTMGHSIALGAAMAGFPIKIWGHSESDVVKGQADMAGKLAVLLDEGVIDSAQFADIKGKIVFGLDMEETLRGVTFVIEAVPEILTLKQELYQKLDNLCDENVVLASNTSGLSPSEISKLMTRPERMVVTHFWNPGHLIPLVEVVRGEKTNDKTVLRAMDLMNAMGKKPIEVKKDIAGFIGNRLQYALFREAQYILDQGIASVEDIDVAVKYSIGRRLSVTGPFVSADMGGLDVFDNISSYLFEDLSKDNQSLPTMANLVKKGKFGQKNGAGFYEWTAEFSEEMNKAREKELIEWLKKDLNS